MKKINFIHSSFNKQSKRAVDLILVMMILIILLPILIITWPFLFWKIGQPIIFKQKRTGKNGKPFTIYKFRTMVKNAESLRSKNHQQLTKLNYAPAPMFKIKNDPRFLKIGKFLSYSGLDELPQLINVLEGQMSLVGPRPLPKTEADALKKIDFNWYTWRHQVKPGLFSLWVLNNERHKNLESWKRFEKETLTLNLGQQYLLILQIIATQLQKITGISHVFNK
jgi:lipopolysaccharide/colanic/teichoic acid biosynthesis glycosyltransferase